MSRLPIPVWRLILILALCQACVCSVAQGRNAHVIPELEKVAPDIFRVRDGCNTYIIRSGNSAILIDAGSPDLVSILKSAGISKVDWILHTHYHRDQCVADNQLKVGGASIAIGKAEAKYLGPSPTELPFIPVGRNPYLALPDRDKMAPVIKPGLDRILNDGEVIPWNDYRIKVVLTPGHTAGSVSYAVDRGGTLFCFTGDLIEKGGHVADLYSMQWNYLENPGIDSSLTSLQKIGRMKPSVLFPSHGDVILNPAEEIHILSVRLENLQQYLHIDRAVRWNWSDFIRVSAHVVQDCGTTSQFVIAPGGEALMFDCGDDMTPERLESLKKAFGIRRIDVIIPSHWHYDHVNGIPAIVAREGSKVWVWNKLAEHLEHPERFPTTCWNGIRIQVDRLLEEGQFNWSGYNFSVYPNPVHMEEQMALSSEIDGLKFYFIGDGSAIDREGHLRSALHCYNGISLNHALIGTAMSFHKAEPYICIAAHSNGFGVPDDAGAEFLKWAVNTTDAIRAILPSGFEETSFNPYWASFYPARTITKPGDKITLAFRIKNDGLSGLSGRFSLNGYDFLTFNNPHYPFLVLPGETKDIEFSTVLSERIKPGVYLITADILCNGRLYREFAEGYVEVGSTPTTTNIQPEL